MSSSVGLKGYQDRDVRRPIPGPYCGDTKFGPLYVAETNSVRPKYFARLLRYLRRKGRSREDAEDLIQEALLRLYVYGQSDAIEDEEAFLRRAVHNLAIDRYRHDRPPLHRGVPIEEVDRLTPLIAPGPTPDVILENRQCLDYVTALLDALNRRTRQIYFAHRCGYTYAEIAHDLGIAEITIKRHIARAQAALESQQWLGTILSNARPPGSRLDRSIFTGSSDSRAYRNRVNSGFAAGVWPSRSRGLK